MKVLYVQVLLEKNEHFSTPVFVYPWELPVFAAAHRNSGITELGKRVFEKKVAPRADIEYERLGNRYKSPEGTDMTYVSAVYGHGTQGVKKLQEAMKEAAAEQRVFIEQERLNPTPPVAVKAIEFASPFGDVEAIPDEVLGVETQADLRRLVAGETEVSPAT